MNSDGFFRIDRRTWAAVCELGMNPAVAYPVLACGTGGDNRTTAWSAEAVARYSGMAWKRSKPAVQELCKYGFVTQIKNSTRPRYELLDWAEVEKTRPAMNAYQRSGVFDKVARAHQLEGDLQRQTADALVKAGRLCRSGDGYTVPATDDAPLSEQYVWLPNTIVMGTHAGEDSPLARIRRTGDVLTLRLLVDLYHAQHLRDDGGIDRAVLCEEFERTRVGEQGIHVIWSFVPAGQYWVSSDRITQPHWEKGTDGKLMFWRRLSVLQQQGLVEWIPHLCESDKPDAEIIHPYGRDWSATGLKNLENAVGHAAYRAGEIMGKRSEVVSQWMHTRMGALCLAPVLRDYPDVAMVGIARLRYRPHTKLTSQWWARQQGELPGIIKQYQQLTEKAAAVRHQG